MCKPPRWTRRRLLSTPSPEGGRSQLQKCKKWPREADADRQKMRGGPRYIQLPDHFTDSLRVLFDVLDNSRSGFVPLEQVGFPSRAGVSPLSLPK